MSKERKQGTAIGRLLTGDSRRETPTLFRNDISTKKLTARGLTRYKENGRVHYVGITFVPSSRTQLSQICTNNRNFAKMAALLFKRLDIRAVFDALDTSKQLYAHHMSRYVVLPDPDAS